LALHWTRKAARLLTFDPARPHREAAAAAADADVAVPAERPLEEERIGAGWLLQVEKTEDAEGRQQIAGKFNRAGARPKADSEKEVQFAWSGKVVAV
jgi:hypothetical protein